MKRVNRIIGLSLAGLFTTYMGHAQTENMDQPDTKTKMEQTDPTQWKQDQQGRKEISEGQIPEEVMKGFKDSRYGAYKITEVYKLTGDAANIIPNGETRSTDMGNQSMSDNNMQDSTSAEQTAFNNMPENNDMAKSEKADMDTTAMDTDASITDETATTDTYTRRNQVDAENMEASNANVNSNMPEDNNMEKGDNQANANSSMSGMNNSKVFYEIHAATVSDNAILYFSEDGEIYDTSVDNEVGE